MRKYLLAALTAPIVIFSSCSKTIEDRLIGNWKLDESYRRRFLDRDYFQTGYESGVFTFYESGAATYISATDTLNGTWVADRYNDSYYSSSSGQWENRSLKYLRLRLVNFLQNRFIEWEFDDFHFRNSWERIRAEQYSLSNDRVYEFRRQ